jgi:membrane associated rhomboid family serine protease
VLPLKDNVPTRHAPVVTWALILANVLVWLLYQLPDLQGSVDELAFHPCEVERSCRVVGQDWPVTVLTSMFMHGSWMHLLGNMLFLYIFGNNVEDALGRVRYLLFYVLAGLAATALQTVITLGWGAPADGLIPNVGASGAIAGVLGAYFMLLPGAAVLTWIGFFIVPVPAFIVLGLWFVFQLWAGSASFAAPEAGGGVAFFAHVGGFLFGMMFVRAFQIRHPLRA